MVHQADHDAEGRHLLAVEDLLQDVEDQHLEVDRVHAEDHHLHEDPLVQHAALLHLEDLVVLDREVVLLAEVVRLVAALLVGEGAKAPTSGVSIPTRMTFL